MKNLIGYFREAYAELIRVSWPTRAQVINYTILVVIISLIVAAFLGILDYFFGQGITKYIKGTPEDIAPIEQVIEIDEDGVVDELGDAAEPVIEVLDESASEGIEAVDIEEDADTDVIAPEEDVLEEAIVVPTETETAPVQ